MSNDWKGDRAEYEARKISEEMTKAAQARKAAEEAAKKTPAAPEAKPAPKP